MKLGISSYTYTWAIGVPGSLPSQPLGAIDLLDRASDLGVSVVQVVDNLPLDKLSEAELCAFEQHAQQLELDIEVGTRGIAPEHLTRYLELAKRLKSPILRALTDTHDHQPDEAEVLAILRRMVPEFERADVVLAIENHDRFPTATLVRILKAIDSKHVGICLDTVNSFGALEGPAVALNALAPWTVNLHLKDFTIQRASHQAGFAIEGRPAGQGRLDVPWLLQGLRDAGRDVNAILELWTSPEKDLAATIAKEAEWVVTSIEYLRQLID